MFYYKLFLELIFYGLILFAIVAIFVNFYNRIAGNRRSVRKSLRIIKNWY